MKYLWWLLAICALLLIVHVCRLLFEREPRGFHRDEVRLYTGALRTQCMDRADHRCEWINALGARCSRRATHGDHWIPHSRGGATSSANFVALCSEHNLWKSDTVPYRRWSRRIHRSRVRRNLDLYPGSLVNDSRPRAPRP